MQTEMSYREFLQSEFERRRKRNPAYSLRSFARDLRISVASLSKVFTGKQGFSPTKAKQISSLLELSSSESELFCTLVEKSHGRSKISRETALRKLQETPLRIADLSTEYFKTISEWHYYAILELPGLDEFQSDPAWIANRLGISVTTAKDAIARLAKLELITIKSDGSFKKTAGYLSAASTTVPNRAYQNHHRQLLQKADEALDQQGLKERDFSAVTFSMNSKDMAWAKEELKKFRRALSMRLHRRKNKNRIYQLNLELFALDQINSGEKNEK